MKKVISYFILIFICIFGFNLTVKGYAMYEENLSYNFMQQKKDLCGDSCLTMCSYKVKKDMISSDGNPYSYWYGVYILYNYDNGIKIVMDNDKINKYDIFDLSDSNVKYNVMISSEGKCPKYAYIDFDFFNEVCFDDHEHVEGEEKDNKGFCEEKQNAGTTYIKSYTKESDIIDSFRTYYSSDDTPKFSCDDIYIGKTKEEIKNEFENEINTDIKINFFDGHDIPSFISNSESYNRIVSRYNDQIDDQIRDCSIKITNDPNLTEEKREDYLNNLEEVKDEVHNAIDKSTSSKPSFDDYEGDDVKDCDLLGVEFKEFLEDMFRLIQIVGPILALILGMLDLLKAVASGEDDAKKKAFKNLGYRMIAALLLFLIPAIMTFMLSLIPGLGGTCGIG